MDQYITGAAIKALREKRRMTQYELAEKLGVSDKAVSKWETGRGYPDITLLEPLAGTLGVSVPELLSGNSVSNTNICADMSKVKFYVCPVCGNIVSSVGESVVSCHGVVLPPLEAEEAGGGHDVRIENVEDEYYVCSGHPMTREHFISFIAAVSCRSVHIVKLYPEEKAGVRLPRRMTDKIYSFCNRDGLFIKNPPVR